MKISMRVAATAILVTAGLLHGWVAPIGTVPVGPVPVGTPTVHGTV
jgi:hypothetical protein